MTIARGQPILADDMLNLTFFPVGSILMMDGSWTDGRGGWYICDGRTTPHGRTPDLKDKFIRGGVASGSTGGGSVTLATANLPSHNHSLTGLTITGGGAHSHGSGTLAAASGSATHSHGLGTLAVSVTGGTHGHAITDPGHTHTVTAQADDDSGIGYLTGGNYGGDNDGTINTGRKTTGITIAATTGSHSHTVSISGSTATDGAAHEHGITGSTASGGGAPQISGGTISDTGGGTAFNVVPAYYTLIYIKKMA